MTSMSPSDGYLVAHRWRIRKHSRLIRNFIIALEFIRFMVTAEQAKNMREKVDIEGVVARKGDTRTVNMRSGGTIDVCDAYLTDDSGEIKLTLWAEDIQAVNNGDRIKITNGYINSFKGEVALTKGKFGKMEVVSNI